MCVYVCVCFFNDTILKKLRQRHTYGEKIGR